ncbi:MAG: hypothetical protein PHD01_12870 [Geobacteraceae bacterium]|nr:hypothetical protein [Geobacteraceae bacterium]
MLIPVIYLDGAHDMIESQSLSRLLRKGTIKSFMRSSGWVHVGKDSIRRFDYNQRELMAKDLPHNDHQLLEQNFPQ